MTTERIQLSDTKQLQRLAEEEATMTEPPTMFAMHPSAIAYQNPQVTIPEVVLPAPPCESIGTLDYDRRMAREAGQASPPDFGQTSVKIVYADKRMQEQLAV